MISRLLQVILMYASPLFLCLCSWISTVPRIIKLLPDWVLCRTHTFQPAIKFKEVMKWLWQWSWNYVDTSIFGQILTLIIKLQEVGAFNQPITKLIYSVPIFWTNSNQWCVSESHLGTLVWSSASPRLRHTWPNTCTWCVSKADQNLIRQKWCSNYVFDDRKVWRLSQLCISLLWDERVA
jgi:hypothetical protein